MRLGRGRGLLGHLEAQLLPASAARWPAWRPCRSDRSRCTRPDRPSAPPAAGSTPAYGRAEGAADGPLDVRAQRRRRGVDVQDAPRSVVVLIDPPGDLTARGVPSPTASTPVHRSESPPLCTIGHISTIGQRACAVPVESGLYGVRMDMLPYGSWPSPVTVEMLTSSVLGLSAPVFDGDRLYWLEARADQGGRVSLWRQDDARRTGGGHPSTVERPQPGQRVRRRRVRRRATACLSSPTCATAGCTCCATARSRSRSPRPCRCGTPTSGCIPTRDLILAVREDHRAGRRAGNTIVALDVRRRQRRRRARAVRRAPTSTPVRSSRARRPAGLDRVEPPAHALGRIGAPGRTPGVDGRPRARERQAGGGRPGGAAVTRPRWTPDGRLFFLSEADRAGGTCTPGPATAFRRLCAPTRRLQQRPLAAAEPAVRAARTTTGWSASGSSTGVETAVAAGYHQRRTDGR